MTIPPESLLSLGGSTRGRVIAFWLSEEGSNPWGFEFWLFPFQFSSIYSCWASGFFCIMVKKTLYTNVQVTEPQTYFLQSKMLKLGHSKPWQDALEQLTGERKMSARPILQVLLGCHLRLKSINQAPSNFYLKGIFGNNTGVDCIGAPSS